MSARPKKSASPVDNALLRISQHRCEIWRDGRFPLVAAYGPTITRSLSRLIVRRLSRPRYSRLQLQCADEEVSFSLLGNPRQAAKLFPGPLPAKPLALRRSAFRTRTNLADSILNGFETRPGPRFASKPVCSASPMARSSAKRATATSIDPDLSLVIVCCRTGMPTHRRKWELW